jgi:hypothetical protein
VYGAGDAPLPSPEDPYSNPLDLKIFLLDFLPLTMLEVFSFDFLILLVEIITLL